MVLQTKFIFIPHRHTLDAIPPTVLFSAAPLMCYSAHVTRSLVLILCDQVVGEADREEHPSFQHAGGSGQSGGSDGSERREKRLGSEASMGEGLPGQRKKHTFFSTAITLLNQVIHHNCQRNCLVSLKLDSKVFSRIIMTWSSFFIFNCIQGFNTKHNTELDSLKNWRKYEKKNTTV